MQHAMKDLVQGVIFWRTNQELSPGDLCPSQEMKDPSSRTSQVSQCAFGSRWKKPTKVHWWHAQPQVIAKDFAGKVCHTTRSRTKGKPGTCSFSKLPHEHLEGLSNDKKEGFKTHKAAEYPWLFAMAIAKVLLAKQ